MKKLLYLVALFAVLWFVSTRFGPLVSTLLALILIGVLLWTKRATLLVYFATQAYFVKGDKEKALRRFQSAYKTGVMTHAGKVTYAAFSLYTGQYEKCRRLLSSVVNSSKAAESDRINARHYFAILAWKEDDLDEAITLMEQLHKEVPATSTYGTLGAFYVERAKRDGNYQETLEFMLEAYDYNATDKTICDNLGELYLLTKEYVKAEGIFAELLKNNQTSPVPYFHYGLALKGLGKNDEAKANFEKALTCSFARSLTVSRDMIKEELAQLN